MTLAAFAIREPAPRRRRTPWLIAAVTAGALATGAAVSPPGQAVGGWVRDAVDPRPAAPAAHAERSAAPLPHTFPGPGRLLVTAGGRAWTADPSGARRLLGPADDAQWSPHGLHVALITGDRLRVVRPDGALRWDLVRPGLADARWSPDGYRIAYRSGSELRLVAGDGSADQVLRRGVAPAAPAWRPTAGGGHVLAYADRRGRVHVVRTDDGGLLARRTQAVELARSAPGEVPLALAFTADGRRLVAVGRRTIRRLDAGAALLHRPLREPDRHARGLLAASPRERAFVAVGQVPGGDVVTLRPTDLPHGPFPVLAAGPGRVTDVLWSPTGDRVLVVRGDDLLLIERARGRVRTIPDFLDRYAGTPRSPARVRGWCCAP